MKTIYSTTAAGARVRAYGPEPRRTAVLHGGPGACGAAAVLARRLAEITAAKYGFGTIEPIQSALSVEGLLDELEGQLAEAAELPVVLVGHSWGALLALLYAARRPKDAEMLVLVGCAPLEDEYVSAIYENRLRRLSAGQKEEYKRIASLRPEETFPGDLLRLGELAEEADCYDPLPTAPDADGLGPDAAAFGAVWPQVRRLRTEGVFVRAAALLRCPVTVIHGRHDPHPAEGIAEPLRKAGVHFRMHLLEECGHTPFAELRAADEFYALLTRAVCSREETWENRHI